MKKLILAGCLIASLTLQAANPAQVPNKAKECIACHGQEGNSTNPLWPNIAGQHASYLQKQLLDFKQGTKRNTPLMTAIVAGLSNEDIDQLSQYYATLPLATNTVPSQYLKRGEQLYRGGDFTKRITACIACHGPKGEGNAQAKFPLLSGQHAPYTIAQLQAFKNKTRQNDLNTIMHDISARMDEEDMTAVAYYIQGLY